MTVIYLLNHNLWVINMRHFLRKRSVTTSWTNKFHCQSIPFEAIIPNDWILIGIQWRITLKMMEDWSLGIPDRRFKSHQWVIIRLIFFRGIRNLKILVTKWKFHLNYLNRIIKKICFKLNSMSCYNKQFVEFVPR